MEYELIYEVSKTGFLEPALMILLCLLFVFIGYLFTKYPFIFARNMSKKQAAVFADVWMPMSILFLVTVLASTLKEQVSVRYSYYKKDFKVIEGKVKQFTPYSRRYSIKESFVVNDLRFEMTKSSLSLGFDQKSYTANPIKNGTHVRIRHKGNKILKLEIAKSSNIVK